MAEPMDKAEYEAFMMHGTRTGKLATVRADGRPHVVPVWFVLDDDGSAIFMTAETTVKAKNMRRDNRVVVSVDDENPPYSFVMFEGEAEFLTDISPDEKLRWATRIGGRYMGEDRAEEFGQRNATPEEVVVRVKPTKVVAYRDLTA